ncbi:MAG: TonB-dependent receptor [Neisseriaceae bacterium]|nr:TonB-dependent receptor [Neisseriaceae bacterium]
MFQNHFTFRLSTITCLLASLFFCQTTWADEVEQQQTQQEDTVQQLPAITVIGKRTDKVFQTPAAVSHRDADIFGQDLNTIIRSVPGVSTQHDIGQGGIAVNIRGLEGMGRVNTTVDGVSQSFFQQNPAHGWNGSTAYVDENFIAGTDIQRGSVGGAAGMGALGGAAEFRTISADDVIQKGKKVGVVSVYRMGSNGYGKNAMLGAAIREEFDNGGKISFLGAGSLKNKYGYKNGAGEQIASDNYDDTIALESGLQSRSGLAKIEYKPNRYHSFVFSHMTNRSKFSNNHTPLNIQTRTSLLKYHFNPLSDWVDFNADLSYSKGKQLFKNEEHAQYNDATHRKTNNPSFSLTLQNKSAFEFENSDLSLTYGMKSMNTKYQGDKYSFTNDVVDDLLINGQQKLNGVFIDGEWKNKHWTLGAGLAFERYKKQGKGIPVDIENGTYGSMPLMLPALGLNGDAFNSREHYFNPRIHLAYSPTDWLQFYGNVGKSSRSPNVYEFMYANNARSNPYSINPDLKGESSFNRDIGVNIFKNGVLKNDDTAQLKINYFNNRVKNYILQDQYYLCGNGSWDGTIYGVCGIDDYLNFGAGSAYDVVGLYHNVPGRTKMQGWEIEGGYDFGRFYTNVVYSRTKTNFPHDYLADMGFSHIRTMPEEQWLLDLGTRWLDKKLTVGMRLNYTGKDNLASGVDSDQNKQLTEKIKSSGVIADLYASYKPSDNVQLFVNVDNISNRVYNYALSGGTLGTGNTVGSQANQGTGRGRTIYGGVSIRF